MYTVTYATGAIAASGSTTTTALDLSKVLGDNSRLLRPDGFFGLQYTVTGDGTAKIEFQCSNDNSTYSEPDGASDIATGLVKTSGPGSDGKGYVSFSPDVSRYIRLKVTETGGANTVTLSLILCVQ